MFKRLFRDRRGQGLVEYALLIGGVALISAGGISLFGHKTSDIIGLVTVLLPGAHTDDNAPIVSGHLIDTALNANGNVEIDVATILSQSTGSVDRLGAAVLGPTSIGGSTNGVDGLIVESQ